MLRFPGNGSPDQSHAAESREDARLLAQVAQRDQHALASLYQRRGTVLYSLLARMLGDEMEAQECMQDVFLQIWRRAPTFDSDRSSALAWMVMIARGRGWDRLRSRARRAATHAAYKQEIVSLELEVNTMPMLERGELAEQCAVALQNLPEAQGHALQLAFLRGWTHEEIARAAGEPLGTIKARIRRGLQALRKTIKDRHV